MPRRSGRHWRGAWASWSSSSHWPYGRMDARRHAEGETEIETLSLSHSHQKRIWRHEGMLKLIFKGVLSLMVFLYTSTGGRIGGKMNGGDVLLLTTTGRKSGKQRTVPLI